MSLALLGALLVASVLLAVGTIRADADARHATGRALSHIASLTSWELAEHLTADLNTSAQVSSWYARRFTGRTGSDPAAPLPPPDSIFAVSAAIRCLTCPPRLRGDGFAVLRLDRDPTELHLSGSGWRASDSTALRDLGRRMIQFADSFRTRGLTDSIGPWIASRSPDSHSGDVLLAQIARNDSLVPVALYVLLVSKRSTDSVIARAVHRAPFLPTSLTRGISIDSLVRIEVVTTDRARVFANDSLDAPTSFTAESPVRGVATGLIVRSALTERAGELVGELSATGSRRAQAIAMLGVVFMLTLASAWQLRRRAELERARAEFIASVSHELHTPLALVTAYTETMLAGRTRDDGERRRFLGVVLREAQRLARLVDNVLRLSAVDRPAPALTLTRLDLHDLAREACVEFAPVARSRDMSLCVTGEPLDVIGDRDALRQVVMNVLDNAVKYGAPGQRIDVHVARCGDEACLFVDDAGPGVPVADRERVFERFVRLASALDAGARSGSGIGLSIVRDIVHRHGGRVSLANAPGGSGLRVAITLNRAP